jgi:hypothetical protein
VPLEIFVNDVAAASDGTAFLTGAFRQTLRIGQDEVSAIAGRDTFVAAMAPDGEVAWVTAQGDGPFDTAKAIAIAPAEPLRVAIAGAFEGPSTFGAGTDAVTLVDAAEGKPQAFVVVLDGGGEVVWSSQVLGESAANDVVVVGDEVIVVGSVEGEVSFGMDEGGLEWLMTAQGSADAFVASYALSDGTIRWVEPIGGKGKAGAWAVAADDAGGLVVALTFDGEVTVAEGVERVTAGASHVLVARYGPPDRSLQWVATVESSDDVWVGDAILHGDGAVTLGGSFNVEAEVRGADGVELPLNTAGVADGYLAHLGADGAVVWAYRTGGASVRDEVRRVVAPTDRSLLLSGQYEASFRFGSGEPLLDAIGDNGDMFFLRLELPGQPGG